jgi:hypothetical protein
MIIENRIKISISKRKDDVFLKRDFMAMGSEAQVTRALRQLVASGFIIRFGVGVYAKAKKSALTGKPIPVRPVAVLAPDALKKMGVEVFPSKLVQDYNAGRTTQIPANEVVNTGRRRISRKLAFGNQKITYENDYALAT